MRDGLKNIYQQISSASTDAAHSDTDTGALITEASKQLDEVIKDTESAAMDIMTIVEKQFEMAGKSGEFLQSLKTELPENEALTKLLAINEELVNDLTRVLTALGFQDITGQRIKKVMLALKTIERSVLDLYLSSGLVMNAAAENPDADAEQVQAEAQKAVEDYRKNVKSELKGPDKNAPGQEAIDDMLAQLGL